jgi:hypothetical protein
MDIIRTQTKAIPNMRVPAITTKNGSLTGESSQALSSLLFARNSNDTGVNPVR